MTTESMMVFGHRDDDETDIVMRDSFMITEEVQEDDDGDFYEHIDAPKFVDLTALDNLTGPTRDGISWFCFRVGCNGNHKHVDPDGLRGSFRLQEITAKNANVQLQKTMCKLCPLVVPAKPPRSQIAKPSTTRLVSGKLAKPMPKLKNLSICSLRAPLHRTREIVKAFSMKLGMALVAPCSKKFQVNQKPLLSAMPRNEQADVKMAKSKLSRRAPPYQTRRNLKACIAREKALGTLQSNNPEPKQQLLLRAKCQNKPLVPIRKENLPAMNSSFRTSPYHIKANFEYSKWKKPLGTLQSKNSGPKKELLLNMKCQKELIVAGRNMTALKPLFLKAEKKPCDKNAAAATLKKHQNSAVEVGPNMRKSKLSNQDVHNMYFCQLLNQKPGRNFKKTTNPKPFRFRTAERAMSKQVQIKDKAMLLGRHGFPSPSNNSTVLAKSRKYS